MILHKTSIFRTYSQCKYFKETCVRFYATPFLQSFSAGQQQKILEVLNQSTSEQLLSYNVGPSCVRRLEQWRTTNGTFNHITDIFEVEGVGERILKQLCDRIVTDNKDAKQGSNKRAKQFLVPQLPDSKVDLQFAVGIHIGPTGISWAKFSRKENKLCAWNYKAFTSLPNKLLLTETFDLAISTMQKLPTSDVYIMEANNSSPPGQTQSTNPSYSQHLELVSMLFALINTSQKHNGATTSADNSIQNQVYQLKSKVAARLFKTLVGNEKVSALGAISELVNGPQTTMVPCTPIIVEPALRQYYNGQGSINKELLGQALMLVISFMDLCVYKNPSSIAALLPGKRK